MSWSEDDYNILYFLWVMDVYGQFFIRVVVDDDGNYKHSWWANKTEI